MAAITASMVKELRDKTGAGMMDCKKALAECDGDMEKAIDELRKKGQAVANKRSDRSASEGLIFIKLDGDEAVMLEVNCETDFVARGDDFQDYGNQVVEAIRQAGEELVSGDLQGLKERSLATGRTVAEGLSDLMGKIGEKMDLGRFVRVRAGEGEGGGAGRLIEYVHQPARKIGVLIELRADKPETLEDARVQQLGRDLAMQVAAAQPVAISREQIPGELVERELSIYRDQAKMEGKPEQMWDKIAQGKLGKFYKQTCLLEQEFVKDSDLSVQKLLENVGREVNDTLRVARFERFMVGEGAQAGADEQTES